MHRFLSAFAMALLGMVAGSAAHAQDFPTKPIRLISCCTGFPENAARVMAAAITEQTGAAVVVEPKPGANGMIAAEYVAKAAPDGYTIFIGTNSTHAANQSLFKKLPYDYIKDFVPVSGIAKGSLLIVTRADLPVRSIADLTALARKEPGKLTFGSGSSSARAAIELYQLIAGIKLTHVPYKTNPQVTTDLIGGRIDMAANDAGSLMPHVQAGKLRAMATTGAKRSPYLPDIPSMSEAGVPGYELTFWNAAYLPAGTPPNIVTRVNQIIVNALNHPKMKEHLASAGVEGFPTSSDQLMQFQIAEQDKWHKILTSAGIEPE